MKMQNIVIFVKKCLERLKNIEKYVMMITSEVNLCNLRYSVQRDIPVFFQYGTNYDFNLIINELAKEFRSELQCIPLNGEKVMSFSIPIKKKTC